MHAGILWCLQVSYGAGILRSMLRCMLQWEHRYYMHPYNIYGGSDIDTFPGWTRPASHAATNNIHTTRHSYVATVVLEMQLIAS